MSIDRPRRIFRHGPARASLPRGILAGLLGAVAGVGLMFAAFSLGGFGGLFTGNSESSSPPLGEISAMPGQVSVIDGETLRVGATVLRLSGVAAPPRGQACAAGPDCGGRASIALAGLLRDRSIVCQISASGTADRPVARCEADGRDINAALVEIGWARAISHTLDPMQSDAQAHRRGMWVAG